MSTMTDTDLDGQIKTLEAEVKRLEEVNDDAIANAPRDPDTKAIRIDAALKAEFQKNLADINEAKEQRDLFAQMKSLREYGNQPERSPVAFSGQALTSTTGNGNGHALTTYDNRPKSLAEMFTESDAFKALDGGKAGLTMTSPWEINIPDMAKTARWLSNEVKDVYLDMPSGDIPGGFRSVQRDDVVLEPMRRMRVRDLFPVQTTTAGIIEYFRITGYVDMNNASMVPERANGAFALKPQTELEFVGRQTMTRIIAHWEAVHRTVIADVPQLRGIIDTELMYGLRLHEDYQILQGTGTGEDLPGILNDPDIQTYARPGSAAANEQKADDIRRAMTKAILSYYEPTGVVVHPNDWEDIELIKDSQGRYITTLAVTEGAAQRLWRVPVVDTPAMPEGTFLTGAFGLGATLYDREQANIRIAEQHADFFLRNAVVVLAEERLALAVKRPESFVKGTFGA